MTPIPRFRRLPRLAPALLLAAGLAACIDTRAETSQTGGTLDLFADTIPVGLFELKLATNPDITQPDGVDRAIYTNTTTRSFSRVGIALAENFTFVVGTCVPLRPVFLDTILTSVLPGDERTVVSGAPLPRSMQVFLTEAVSGGIQLVPPIGGRWTGTITTWLDTTATVYSATGYSDGQGAFSSTGVSQGDTLILNGVLESPNPLSLSGYPNRCEGLWQVVPLETSVAVNATTLTVRGSVVPQLSATQGAPDSVRIDFTRVP